jgi:hypothetical protein
MIRLVSLDRVKAFNRVIHDADDAMLDMSILAASAAVIDYLGGSEVELGEFDSDGYQVFDMAGNPLGVPDLEQVATAMLVGKMYDGFDSKDLDYGRLPREVTSMLYIRRREMGLA